MSEDNQTSGFNFIPLVLILVCVAFAYFVFSQIRSGGSSSYVYPQPAYTQRSEDIYKEQSKSPQVVNSDHIPTASEIEAISQRYDGQKRRDMKEALCAVYKTC